MTYKGDIFTQLENIANSEALKNLAMINGIVRSFAQRGTGDCWLLASFYALSSSEASAQLIHDAIQRNDDYTAVKYILKR